MQGLGMWWSYCHWNKACWICSVSKMGKIFVESKAKFRKCTQYFLKSKSNYFLLFQLCSNSHVAETWCSQPILNRRLHGGDLLISFAILFSGNYFNKIEIFAKILHTVFSMSVLHQASEKILCAGCGWPLG